MDEVAPVAVRGIAELPVPDFQQAEGTIIVSRHTTTCTSARQQIHDVHKFYRVLCRGHRKPEHVMRFLLAELATIGNLDEQQRLVVRGRFAPKNCDGVLRRYINEYVTCNVCNSRDTILTSELRISCSF